MTEKELKVLKSKRFHLNEFQISSFCPNTLKAFNLELNKFLLFQDKLCLFFDNPAAYEKTLESYSSYIVYMILLESLKTKQNIKTFEAYFYNVLQGFALEKKVKIRNNFLASLWTSLEKVYVQILDVCSDPLIKQIEIDKTYFFRLRHINTVGVNLDNYYFNVPLKLIYEDRVEILQILPVSPALDYLSNLFTIVSSNVINKLTTIHFIGIVQGLNTHVDYRKITLSTRIRRHFKFFFDGLYIDFNKINIHNCMSCPLSCTAYEVFSSRYELKPWTSNKLSKIKVLNI